MLIARRRFLSTFEMTWIIRLSKKFTVDRKIETVGVVLSLSKGSAEGLPTMVRQLTMTYYCGFRTSAVTVELLSACWSNAFNWYFSIMANTWLPHFLLLA